MASNIITVTVNAKPAIESIGEVQAMIRSRAQLLEALRELHSVCVRMDAEFQDARPTEEEYQAAMAGAAAALAGAALE